MREIRKVQLIKAGVRFMGEKQITQITARPRTAGGGGNARPPARASISEMIDDIRNRFAITDQEALFIREICEEKVADPEVQSTVKAHKEDTGYLDDFFTPKLITGIKKSYIERKLMDRLLDDKYTGKGAIIDIMAYTVIQHALGK